MLEINSVWTLPAMDNLDSGNYRVLALYPEVDQVIIFKLEDEKRLLKPNSFRLSDFKTKISRKVIHKFNFERPQFQLIDEQKISSRQKETRDRKYLLIKDLISKRDFLFTIANHSKSTLIADEARNKNVKNVAIYRALNQFWKFGQDENALLPAFANSGGRGTMRQAGEIKRGKPISSNYGNFALFTGINITEDHQIRIKKGVKKFYLNDKRIPLSKAYEETLKEFYQDEIERAEVENDFQHVPSLNQFRYWTKKLYSPEELIKQRTSQIDFEKNKRAVLHKASKNAPVPGMCFEIDATVADVHIVSHFRRNHSIGRPTIYSITDRASRMIAGFYVSIENASWKAARKALVNAFTSKKAYCAHYGIDIEDSEWPCFHVPQTLLCDRGELIGEQAEKTLVPMMEVKIASPYRGDMKSIVERRFGILNEDLLHQLDGSTKGQFRTRGEIDPSIEAVYTLNELTTLLLDEVIKHNNRKQFDELATSSSLLIQNGLKPTPLNFWNIHMHESMHALKTIGAKEVYARFLPEKKVSVTRQGFKYGELYYTCDRAEQENIFAVARTTGRWKLEARIDEEDTSYIYVRLDKHRAFEKCSLLDRSEMLGGLQTADVYYFQDWQKANNQRNKPTTKEVEAHERKKEITKAARQSKANAPPLATKKEGVTNIKERRREEIRRMANEQKSEAKTEIQALSHIPNDPTHQTSPSALEVETENSSNVLNLLRSNKRKNVRHEDD